jgi:predicted transcriptional regulator of viral defense system
MKQLGKIENLFFAYIQMRRLKSVRAGDMQEALDLSAIQERKLLSRLSRAKLITRVRRGLYLVPERLPLGGVWTADAIFSLNTLMEELGGRYQICGLNAFNYYGYDEQVPMRIYAYNNKISGERALGAVTVNLIRVDTKRLGATRKIKKRDGITTIYPSRARTLLDAVYDWARFNTLPRAYKWIRGDLREKRVTPDELAGVTLRFGDVGTVRRMGALLESEGADETTLQNLEKTLKPTSAFIPFVPGKPKRGRVNKRWGVVMNES